ncbi:MAG: regulatory protein RecX [Gammaproteobacteria bacterium]
MCARTRSTAPPPDDEPDADKKLEIAAIRLLARREHSTEELKRKLLRKGFGAEAVERVVQKLAAKRLVSDARFVASFIRHHAARGRGPVRIRAELRQQGIADEHIEEALEAAELDWVRLACEVRARKFGSGRPSSVAERAKQARFLQYRGFTADQIRVALIDQGEGRVDLDSEPCDPAWPD